MKVLAADWHWRSGRHEFIYFDKATKRDLLRTQVFICDDRTKRGAHQRAQGRERFRLPDVWQQEIDFQSSAPDFALHCTEPTPIYDQLAKEMAL